MASPDAVQFPNEWRLDGRVCVITGATSGIGRVAARVAARLGADVAIVGRAADRLARVERELRDIAPGIRVHSFCRDLSAMKSVRALAGELLDRLPRIHVLVNNAGVFTKRRVETVDGFETQFAVNHLAPFLLTNLVLERVVASAPSRIVCVASQVERSGRIDFGDLHARAHYDGVAAYRQSKLANVLFARALASRVDGTGVTVLSLHPGVYTTRLLDDYSGWSSIVTRFVDRGLPGPDASAWVFANAIASPALAANNGAFLHEGNLASPSPQAQDAALAERLWAVSAQLTDVSA